jgi:hypothetical protein
MRFIFIISKQGIIFFINLLFNEFKLTKIQGPPKIMKGLHNDQVKEGEVLILKALVLGNPFPRVFFNFIFHFL